MVASDRNSVMTSSNEESGAGLASGIARSSHTNDLSRNLSFSLLGSDFASAGFSLSQASRHHHKKRESFSIKTPRAILVHLAWVT